MLYGPSGVGKSSLLHAGVMHRLRKMAEQPPGDARDAKPTTAVVLLDDWSGDPVAQLTAKILALVAASGAARAPAGADEAGGVDGLLQAVRAYEALGRGGLLLIFDQFEEHIRRHPDLQHFDEVVPELVRERRHLQTDLDVGVRTGYSVRVLLSVREDRLADLDRFRGRIPRLFGNVLRLGPMSPAAALEAITGPIAATAARASETERDVKLQARLAEQVVQELVELGTRRGAGGSTKNGAGGKPHIEASFMQLVMRRLWDEDIVLNGRSTVLLETLDGFGGAAGIVNTHLDASMARLTTDEQNLTAQMLRHLVTPSGATACLTAYDLHKLLERPEDDIRNLAEKLSNPPARILRGVAGSADAAGAGGYELPQILANPALAWATGRRTRRLEERARRLLLALVAMTAIVLALVGYMLKPDPLMRLDATSVDTRFDVRGAQPADSRIVLVTLDKATYAEEIEGNYRARAVYARALPLIAGARPSAIVSTLRFTKRGKSDAADAALIDAAARPGVAERLILGADRIDDSGLTQLFGDEEQVFDGPSSTQYPDGPWAGYTGLPRDPGNVARRIDRGVAISPEAKKLDTLAVAAAQVAGDVRFEQLPESAWIDYRGGAGTFPRVAFSDVLDGRQAALAKLRGKVVVLGIDGGVLTKDPIKTSAPGAYVMDVPEVQANAISSALRGFPLRDGGRVLDIALIVVLGLLALGLALRLGPRLVMPLCLALGALYCVAAQLAFGGGRVISVVYPLTSLALAAIGVTIAQLVREAALKRAARKPANAA